MLLGVLLLGAGAVVDAGDGPRLVAEELGTVPSATAYGPPAGTTGGAVLRPVPARRVLPVLARPEGATGRSPDGAVLPGAPTPGAATPEGAAPEGAARDEQAAAGPGASGPGAPARSPAWRTGDLRPGAPVAPPGPRDPAAPAAAGPGAPASGTDGAAPAAPGSAAPDPARPGPAPPLAARRTGPAPIGPQLPWTVSPIYPPLAGPGTAAPPGPVVPATLELPDRGIVAPVEAVGTGPNGGMVVPEQVDTVGWWAPGVLPGGTAGSTVIAGHVDSATQGLGVLAVLPRLTAGEPVVVRGADGRAASFRVVARREYDKHDLPREIFRRDGPPQLVLVTCGGVFDPVAGSYESNIVVYAVPDHAT